MCLVLAGGFVERSPAARQYFGKHMVIVHPAGERHSDCFSPEGALCLNVFLDSSRIQPLVRRSGRSIAVAIQELAAETVKGEWGDHLTVEAAVAEITHGLWDEDRSGDAADCVSRVLEALDDGPESSWTLSALARIAGRHPTHLARAFRERTGMSIGKYRRRRRLIRLCVDLRTSARGLSELAAAHGYADQAHMTREVKRFIGTTPLSLRRHANFVQDPAVVSGDSPRRSPGALSPSPER